MFSPKTLSTLSAVTLITLSMVTARSEAQTSAAQYDARMAAMQQARARGATQTQNQVRTVAAQQPVTNQNVQAATVRQNPVRVASGGYRPRHTRTAQLISPQGVVDGGSPIVGDSVITPPVASEAMGIPTVGQPMMSTPMTSGSTIVDGTMIYGEEVISDCDTCGDAGGYFTDDCCGRGGCPDDMPCWTGPLGRALRNGSYFFGATAFRHPAYGNPTSTAGDLLQDSNFGAYAGFNLGIPLCRLTCGKLSGQFGLRSVQTNFSGSDISDSGRDQLFMTAGLYRRVDYGLQAGVVVDVLREEYFTSATIAQLRGEVSWAYPTGAAIGFRFTSSQQDDDTPGTINGLDFQNFNSTTDENYRIFVRKNSSMHQGFEELFLGWTNNDHFALGADVDIPVGQFVALEAGAAYYLSDLQNTASNLGNTRIDDAFNLYLGFAFRPQGVGYYRSYDRPLLPVADNGTMIIRR